jgi:predicted outer membrane repeat protein
MHLKFLRGMANTVVIGGIVTLGLGSAPAAMAQPVVDVTCSSSALAAAMTAPTDGTTLELFSGCTYVLTSALPTVDNTLTIAGQDATLERSYHTANSFSIITVGEGNLTLDDVNFTNGGGSGDDFGGAIDNDGTLTVNGGIFLGNHVGQSGGAIVNDGSLTVDGAEFTGNSAQAGGAIFAAGNMTVDGADFTGNSAVSQGGALYIKEDAWVNGTLLWRNGAEYGGAIENLGSIQTSYTTIVQNDATEYGGGVVNGYCTTLIADHSSIVDNVAGDSGGGIYDDYADDTVTLHGTIVLGNRPDNYDQADSDCGGHG